MATMEAATVGMQLNLKDLLLLNRKTCGWMAKAIGVSYAIANVQILKRGYMTVSEVKRLARALEVPVGDVQAALDETRKGSKKASGGAIENGKQDGVGLGQAGDGSASADGGFKSHSGRHSPVVSAAV